MASNLQSLPNRVEEMQPAQQQPESRFYPTKRRS
jgi:hypothetical protein